MFRPKSTLEQWRIFQAVVEYGGYAQAAERLNKSQSSLNHAVMKLQQTLGVALLEVKGRKAVLTEAGELFLRRAKRMSLQMEELELLATNIHQGWEAELRIIVELAHPRHLLFTALSSYYPESRGTHVQIFNSVLTGTDEYLQEGKADIIIAGTIPKGFLGDPLAEVTFIPVCHPLHPLAASQHLFDAEELSQYLQIVIRDTARKPKETTGWLKSEQRWTVSGFDEAKLILKQGVGFCWLPSHLLTDDIQNGELTKVSLREGQERKIFTHMIIPHPERLGPSGQLLVQHLKLVHGVI